MLVTLVLTALLGGAEPAAQLGSDVIPTKPKAWAIDQVTNEESGFMIRVAVDRKDRVYYEGEPMTVTITPERDCYVYLIYYDAQDNIACLFPNEFQTDNFIRAKSTVEIPAQGDSFRYRATAPFGEELLQVVATLQPIDVFKGKGLKAGRATPLSFGEIKKGMQVVKQEADTDIWAEARVSITTKPGKPSPDQDQNRNQNQDQNRNQDQNQGKTGKRIAVCVGISDYKDAKVPKLRVCHQDAQRMADALRSKCAVDDVVLLTNEQATQEAIRKAIFEDAVRKTRPGDTVFLYFSGHGGRTADTNGDESDGLDEYLVPYDGVLGSPDTMIIDDMFARWVQELDGREVCMILDNCYSGGSSKAIKGLDGAPAPRNRGAADFFDGELKRAKDIGQTGTAVMAASQANQIAWEMPTGDGSVLTYYLLKGLDDSGTDTNRDGKISLKEAYATLEAAVKSYVQKTFQADQDPVFIDNDNDKLILRP